MFYELAVRHASLVRLWRRPSWFFEDNGQDNKSAEAMNGKITKRHRIYELLTETKASLIEREPGYYMPINKVEKIWMNGNS